MTNEVESIVSDEDSVETKEWLDALASVIKFEGKERAEFILKQLFAKAQQSGVNLVSGCLTPYLNPFLLR